MKISHQPPSWSSADVSIELVDSHQVMPAKASPTTDVSRHRFSLADLGNLSRLTPMFDYLDAQNNPPKSVALTPVHLANWAIAQIVVTPFVLDGLYVTASASELGVELDSEFNVIGMWVMDNTVIQPCIDPMQLGQRMWELICPAIAVGRDRGRISQKNATLVALDSATGVIRHLQRQRPDIPARWFDEVLAAADRYGHGVGPTEVLHVDDGLPIEFPMRRVCCVLHSSLSCNGCPGCPLLGSLSERGQQIAHWLQGFQDEEFADYVGRQRSIETDS